MCVECDEAIYNPICPSCLVKEISVWLKKYPRLWRKVIIELNRYITQALRLYKSATKCVACGNNTTFLCPYCFTAYTLQVLKNNKASKIVLREFVELFNFDFEHTNEEFWPNN